MAKAMRKRVALEAIVDQANKYLASPRTTYEQREGVMTMVEFALFEADNYQGFRYLDENEVKLGEPGIFRNKDEEEQFIGTDRTRVQYALKV